MVRVSSGGGHGPSSLRRWARRVCDVVHRWLGFSSGAILAIAGLTGALLAFYMEIDGAANPALRTGRPHARPPSYEAVYQVLAHLPVSPGGYWKMEIPPDGGPITTRYYGVGSGATMERTRMVTVDPQTLRVMRDAWWRDTLFTWVYDLHMTLLLGPSGKIAMGIVALAIVVMLVGGVLNWLLPAGGWRAKLRVKRSAPLSRQVYDIHKITGLATFPVLLLSMGTAAIICLPAQSHALLAMMAPLTVPPAVSSQPMAGAARIPLDRALALGMARFPGSRIVWLRIPQTPGDTYDLQIRQSGAPMTRFPRTHVWLDQYTGRVLAVHDPARDNAADTVLNWVQPLHDGKAFGLTGRVVVMLVGLAPVILLGTGLMRWGLKQSARRRAGTSARK